MLQMMGKVSISSCVPSHYTEFTAAAEPMFPYANTSITISSENLSNASDDGESEYILLCSQSLH
jgi:hypothetical protein